MKIYLTCLLLILTGFAFSEEADDVATLIVTYKTDSEGERLDRIRFWIRNEKSMQKMYPIGNAFVFDSEDMSRMVVIEGLPSGKYTLEFIVPNPDGYFAEVPIREFSLGETGVVKIDQTIRPLEEDF